MREKKLVVSIFGPIGAGKEGVRKVLEEVFNLLPVSMSEAIRRKRKHDPGYAQRFPKRVGQNYPFEAVELAFNAYIDLYGNNVGFVIDGVPRGTPEQVGMVIDCFDVSNYDVIFLHLICPRHTCEERVRGRREAMLNAGIPEREDDKPEYVEGRLDEHFNEIGMLLEAIKTYKGNLIEVDAEKPQSEVLQEVIERVGSAIQLPVVV